MFALISSGKNRQPSMVVASVALHGLLFAWLLRAREPKLLNPSSIAVGHNGRVLAQVYFPTDSPDNSSSSSSTRATEVYKHQRLGHEKLTLPRDALMTKLTPPRLIAPSSTQDNSKTAMLSSLGHGAPAGRPYGGLPGGPIYGDEIRPALPVATADPIVYPWERPDSEGKVIIEITIDERGEIVRKIVLQSLGSEIDNKCLAALDNWHFQPATHNGVPIASKQDAIFPFKARGSSEAVGLRHAPRPAIIEM